MIRYEHGEHFIHEEHTALELAADSTLAVGDRVELMPGYSPTTVNFYDIYYVVDDGRVVDVWPVLARYGSATAGVGPAPGDSMRRKCIRTEQVIRPVDVRRSATP